MALITHEDKIETYSLDLPFARDEESDYCEWCGGDATHWTQLERGEQPRSRAFFHCVDHELNAQMICTSDEKYTREQVMESNRVSLVTEDVMTVVELEKA